MKISVGGVEYEYEEAEVNEVIGILREDGALKGFRSLQESNREIKEWIAEQKAKGAQSDGDQGANPGSGGGNGGGEPPQPPDPSGDMGKGGKGMPSPPEPVTEEDRQEAKPGPKKSRWWGDAISYDESQ